MPCFSDFLYLPSSRIRQSELYSLLPIFFRDNTCIHTAHMCCSEINARHRTKVLGIKLACYRSLCKSLKLFCSPLLEGCFDKDVGMIELHKLNHCEIFRIIMSCPCDYIKMVHYLDIMDQGDNLKRGL